MFGAGRGTQFVVQINMTHARRLRGCRKPYNTERGKKITWWKSISASNNDWIVANRINTHKYCTGSRTMLGDSGQPHRRTRQRMAASWQVLGDIVPGKEDEEMVFPASTTTEEPSPAPEYHQSLEARNMEENAVKENFSIFPQAWSSGATRWTS